MLLRRVLPLALLLGALACSDDVATTCAAWPAVDGLDLSGTWSVQADPQGTGEVDGWASGPLPAPTSLAVPGCLDTADDALHGYVGKSWWQTTFEGPTLRDGQRAWLVLEGVALRARVFLDGELVGTAPRDHLRFQFDVTGRVGAGVHRLAVEVDNTVLERSIPDTRWNGWWNHTGLIRPVRLELRPAVELAALRLDTRLDAYGVWHATAVATVEGGAGQAGTLHLTLADESDDCAVVFESVSGRTLPQGRGDLTVQVELSNVTPWAPRALPGATTTGPHLYRLTATLETDGGTATRAVRTGFRDLALKGPRVLWNGTPLVLRGVNRHEMHPDTGFALTSTAQRTDLEGIAALGANLVRLAHYPQADEVLDLCDELGLLAWVEIPAWQTAAETLGDAEVWSDVAEPFLTDMVAQYRHHPSVLFWGVGNEFGSHTEPGEAYCAKAADLVRTLDPTRLVTFASDKHELLPLVQVDRCFQHMDAVAINAYYGWYYKQLGDLGPALDALHAAFPQKPVLVSEFGAEAIAGLADPAPPDVGWHGDGTFEFSEDFQLKLVTSALDQIEDAERADWMLGGLIWVWADFADPHRVDDGRPHEQDFKNLKGLVTERREKKRAWTLVNGRWSE